MDLNYHWREQFNSQWGLPLREGVDLNIGWEFDLIEYTSLPLREGVDLNTFLLRCPHLLHWSPSA